MTRPDVVEAKTYRLESGFVKETIYVTLGYVQGTENVPIEIFINTKDLTKLSEYTIITRLVSALFREGTPGGVIVEELTGVIDSAGSRVTGGVCYNSIYEEIAMVISKFFKDIGYE